MNTRNVFDNTGKPLPAELGEALIEAGASVTQISQLTLHLSNNPDLVVSDISSKVAGDQMVFAIGFEVLVLK